MDFFSAVEARRSIRRYTDEGVPPSVMSKAFEAAVLAPNSSNTQTWNFYWVRSPDKRTRLIEACLSQSAARTAAELVVITANHKLWKRSQPKLVAWVNSVQAPQQAQIYYKKLIPMNYRTGILNSWGVVKWLLFTVVGFFRPIMRGPYTGRDQQEVAIKSAALAAENFVLAISAQGFSSCMMEGFDEWRVSQLLRLVWSERVVMVISVGKAAERGTWGPRFRLDLDEVVHEV